MESHSSYDRAQSRAIAVVGNPGTGKSTILNGLVGSPHFRSGMSYGAGLTQRLQEYVMDGVSYFDTPGLNDIEKRKEAGAEIDKLLRSNVSIKLVFVVTVLNGRVQPQDAATIGLVLDAITSVNTNDRFGVIINQISKKFVDNMRTNPSREQLVKSQITGNRFTTHWCYVQNDEDLVESENGMLINSALSRLFANIPETRPVGAVVKQIDTESFDEKIAREVQIFVEKEKRLADELEKQKEAVKEQRSEMKGIKVDLENERAERSQMEQRAKVEQGRMKGELHAQQKQISDAQAHTKDMKCELEKVKKLAARSERRAKQSIEDLKHEAEKTEEEAAARERDAKRSLQSLQLAAFR